MLLRWSTFLRLFRNKYIPLPNFKVEVKRRFQEVSPRFQLLTICHSIIEVFLKRLIVKQLTLKLPKIPRKAKDNHVQWNTRDFTAESNSNFRGLISDIQIISRFFIFSLIKTVKNYLRRTVNLIKLQPYDRWFRYFV